MPKMRKVSRDEVLGLAEELAAEYGESLTLTAFRRETGLSQHVIFDLFGNWKNLRTEVGLTPESPRARNMISKDQILKLMKEQVAEHGERLTENMFLRATGLSGRMVADRFGSWGNLREAMGLKCRAVIRPHYTDEDIYFDLYRVFRQFREDPIYHRHRYRGGKISPFTISYRFGCWRGAKLYFAQFLKDHGYDGESWSMPEELEKKFWEYEKANK
ncbi:MAG: hypothetical protein HON04_15800 [Planctomicrobium sp.]|jgi:hypothetical protein|nr:hypothetical protein [Planctomicrobium sp.]